MFNKLNPQGKRLLTIIVSLPVFVSTSYILYKRLVLEEPMHRPVPRGGVPYIPNDGRRAVTASSEDSDDDLLLKQIEREFGRDFEEQFRSHEGGSSSSSSSSL
ncbi:hypothetical protein BGW42_003644 [Actinomortierella wolfii]|nr:hypothetical protein BGW42_003644 [Actinomortierella wolfii]